MISEPIRRIEAPSEATFRELFLQPQKPVIISGATTAWRAHGRWTREYLEKTIGSKTVRVKDSGSHIHPDLFSGRTPRIATMRFTDYIDLMWSSDPKRNTKYLSGDETRFIRAYTQRDPALEPLLGDFELPTYFDRKRLHTCGFWLSALGTVASLHYDSDGSHNLNVQVKGKKRVLLFSPSEQVYPFLGTQPTCGHTNFSRVNIEDLDVRKFPLLQRVRYQEGTLEEGDMLFIPSFWWHAVYHLGIVNINVNFWWLPEEYRLSKTSMRSSFLDVVARTLTRGKELPTSEELNAAVQALPAETVRFIQDMEMTISSMHKI
jgi:lysine-specific demethylase 8